MTFKNGKPVDHEGKEIYFAHWAGATALPKHGVFDAAWTDYSQSRLGEVQAMSAAAFRIVRAFARARARRLGVAMRLSIDRSARRRAITRSPAMPRLLFRYLVKRIGIGVLVVQFALSVPVVLSYLLYQLPPAAVRGGLVCRRSSARRRPSPM